MLARAGLALTALGALVVLAVGLRASLLEAEATSAITKLRAGQGSPAEAERARDRLERAGELQPGSDALVREALVLLIGGRRGQAAALAERAVRREPENLEAWGVLYQATVGRNPRRAAEAARRGRALNPRAPGQAR